MIQKYESINEDFVNHETSYFAKILLDFSKAKKFRLFEQSSYDIVDTVLYHFISKVTDQNRVSEFSQNIISECLDYFNSERNFELFQDQFKPKILNKIKYLSQDHEEHLPSLVDFARDFFYQNLYGEGINWF